MSLDKTLYDWRIYIRLDSNYLADKQFRKSHFVHFKWQEMSIVDFTSIK